MLFNKRFPKTLTLQLKPGWGVGSCGGVGTGNPFSTAAYFSLLCFCAGSIPILEMLSLSYQNCHGPFPKAALFQKLCSGMSFFSKIWLLFSVFMWCLSQSLHMKSFPKLHLLLLDFLLATEPSLFASCFNSLDSSLAPLTTFAASSSMFFKSFGHPTLP